MKEIQSTTRLGKGTVGSKIGLLLKGTVGGLALTASLFTFNAQAADSEKLLRRLQGAFVNGNHVERSLSAETAEQFWIEYLSDQSHASSATAQIRPSVSDSELMNSGNWVASLTFAQTDLLLYQSVEALIALTPEASWMRREVRRIVTQLNSPLIQWGLDASRKNACGEASPFLVAYLSDSQVLYGVELRPCFSSD